MPTHKPKVYWKLRSSAHQKDTTGCETTKAPHQPASKKCVSYFAQQKMRISFCDVDVTFLHSKITTSCKILILHFLHCKTSLVFGDVGLMSHFCVTFVVQNLWGYLGTSPHACMTSPHACMTSPQVCMASLPIPLTVAWHPPLTPQACMASPTSPLTLAGPPAPVPQARSHGALLLPDMLAWHHQPGPGMHGIIFLMRKLTWHDPPFPWVACHHLSSP
jgi:hypothetical protein